LYAAVFITPSVPQNFDHLDGQTVQQKFDPQRNYSYVRRKLSFLDGFSKVVANTFAPKPQYSLLIAKMFAPKSQYSHRDIASFGDRPRAIFEKYLSNLIIEEIL
jgi:hypothetical protein